eukprot:6597316-Prymnesium_polylepis.1
MLPVRTSRIRPSHAPWLVVAAASRDRPWLVIAAVCSVLPSLVAPRQDGAPSLTTTILCQEQARAAP